MMPYTLRILLSLTLFAQGIGAYEINTHAFLSQKAFERSVLSPTHANSILPVLGLDRWPKTQTFDLAPGLPDFAGKRRYFDDIDTNEDYLAAITRPVAGQEDTAIGLLFARGFVPGFTTLEDAQSSIPGWLMRGAIREDDNDGALFIPPTNIPVLWLTGDDRDSDPYGPIVRAVKHFYDPVRDLEYPYKKECDKYPCERSTTWAMGTLNPLQPAANIPDPQRRNHFTWVDARNSYYLALTANIDKDSNGQLSAVERVESSILRTWRFATTIKSLGHVIHLLQDTAQPQHVRSDAHAPPIGTEDANDEGLADAAIEAYTDYRLLGDYDAATAFSILGNPIRYMDESLPSQELIAPLIVGNYPGTGQKIQFSTPVKFFTTRHIDSQIAARRGLADFSNRSFYTAGSLPGSQFCIDPTFRPGEDGCVLTGNPFPLPPNDIDSPALGMTIAPTGLRINGRVVNATYRTFRPIDSVAPSYIDPTLTPFGGQTPVLLRSATVGAAYASGGFGGFGITVSSAPFYGYTYTTMRYTADVTIPRAIGYSAGLIDFFFRGRLEIEPNAQRLFGVVDLGQPHTVDSDGYPIITASNKILGFEKIRLKVRNLTEAITESGTGAVVPQTVGVGKLVAVARYHRNPCYKPDLSGERVMAYASAGPGVITEPDCPMGVRTDFQEISVSAELPIAGEADLPGGRGGTAPNSVDKVFDFSAQPIPVNATDLFIQVVYRGALGEETDGIAVGNLDVQEPTFFAAWNNTDYYFSELSNLWLAQNPMSFPARGADGVAICAGSPSQLVYRYIPENGPGLPFFLGALTPGVVRLAFVFGKRPVLTSRYSFRVNPLMLPSPSAQQRLVAAPGQERQASREIFNANEPLPAPIGCQFSAPTSGSSFWCFDPIQKRRGQNFGDVAQPIYYSSGANAANGPDVDAPPAHTPFPGLRIRDGGVNRFNVDTVLVACPLPTTLNSAELRSIELQEEAWSLGIDPGAPGN